MRVRLVQRVCVWLTIALAVLWACSLVVQASWFFKSGWLLAYGAGAVSYWSWEYGWTVNPDRVGAHVNIRWENPQWLPVLAPSDPTGRVVLPLWIPVAVVALAYVVARAMHARRPRGSCPHCGYDRRGLAALAVCPECGRTPAPPTPAA